EKMKRDRVEPAGANARRDPRTVARPYVAFRTAEAPSKPRQPLPQVPRAVHTNRWRRDPNSISLLAGIVPTLPRNPHLCGTGTYEHDRWGGVADMMRMHN